MTDYLDQLPNAQSIIISRPNTRVDGLVAQLNELSTQNLPLKIITCPLIDIADYFDWQEVEPKVEPVNFANFDGVIFISGNAVKHAQARLSEENWTQLIKSPLYAIGQQTADVLQSSFEQMTNKPIVKHPQQMNSEGLLKMPELINTQGQQWLIVKGLGGREKLKIGLQQAGAKVAELHVYQRKLPGLMAQKQIASYNQLTPDQTAPIWLITSLQALNNLWRVLNKDSKNCQVIVSSDRIANEANKKGFKIVAQSIDATDKQLASCVKQFIQD